MDLLPNPSPHNLEIFVNNHKQPGTTKVTDNWVIYNFWIKTILLLCLKKFIIIVQEILERETIVLVTLKILWFSLKIH